LDKVRSGDVRDFTVNSVVGIFGGAWSGVLKRLIVSQYDEVNSLRLSRPLQAFLPFSTGYEAYFIGQLIEVMDSGHKDALKFESTLLFGIATLVAFWSDS
jgi:hypothetical protein